MQVGQATVLPVCGGSQSFVIAHPTCRDSQSLVTAQNTLSVRTSQEFTETGELDLLQPFGEHVGDVVFRLNLANLHNISLDVFVDKLVPCVNVLCAMMEHRIFADVDTSRVVFVYDKLSARFNPSSRTTNFNHSASLTASDRATNSDSAEDKVIEGCLEDLQEMCPPANINT
ncbi:hypothetical protein TRICI_005056 [Trichomonascus ciferrii]|uniref:Uncharacterized protein n=1 Tax=Trichomonascus ciferrii TaxID=44093 RepID=A0A642UY79_9ASCO|nr:hypothetical protein TRICI_005056 [Trichomonascus ciferrii]